MEVIYKFDLDDDESNDKYQLNLLRKAEEMHTALDAIQEYVRQHNKGWVTDDLDKSLEKISGLISESGIYDIEW